MPRRAAAKTVANIPKSKKGKSKYSNDESEINKEQENEISENSEITNELTKNDKDDKVVVTKIQIESNGKDDPIKRKAEENGEAENETSSSPIKKPKKTDPEIDEDSIPDVADKKEGEEKEAENEETEIVQPTKGRRGRQPKKAVNSEENGAKNGKPKRGQTTKRTFEKTEDDSGESESNEKEDIEEEPQETKPKRGRPAKKVIESTEPKDDTLAKRGRGKGSKQLNKKDETTDENHQSDQNGLFEEKEEMIKKPKGRAKKMEPSEDTAPRGRGRRPKAAKTEMEYDEENEIEETKPKPKGKRGRPRAREVSQEHEENGSSKSENNDVDIKPKSRGRGRQKASQAEQEDEPKSKTKGRGRPPKAVEKTETVTENGHGETKDAEVKKRGRGRPKLQEPAVEPQAAEENGDVNEDEESEEEPKGNQKTKGKSKSVEDSEENGHMDSEVIEDETKNKSKGRGRGRPKAVDIETLSEKSDDVNDKAKEEKKGKAEKRGRKPKGEKGPKNDVGDDEEYTRKNDYDITKYLTDENWQQVLDSEMKKNYFSFIQDYLGDIANEEFFPPPSQVFNALNTCPIDKIKVVIIGQDPYHDDGQAHGLAFSVPDGKDIPKSLVNIFKELSTDIEGFEKPESGCLQKWAQRGVLLLNTTLTVLPHTANSHEPIGWTRFTDTVIKMINEKCTDVVFLLWGKHAQMKGDLIDEEKHLVLKGAHPSPLAANKFMGCKHFSKANEYLQSKEKEPVDWKL